MSIEAQVSDLTRTDDFFQILHYGNFSMPTTS